MGILVQTTLYGIRDLNKIVAENKLGRDAIAYGSQSNKFNNTPLTFCSYFCEGYNQIYGPKAEGVIFETEIKPVYVCPADSFNLLRGGNWLPEHEQFIFSSIEDMLKKYPTSNDFKKEFQEYFSNLKPEEVYPNLSKNYAGAKYRLDYCLYPDWNPGCNEITFEKPLKIKNPKIFTSKNELIFLLHNIS